MVLRFSLTGVEGYSNDMAVQGRWGCIALDKGVSAAYDDPLMDYPPLYLYVLKSNCYMERLVHWKAFISKLVPNFFDILTALLIFHILGKTGFAYAGFLAYAFNPAVIFNTSWWGQVDSVNAFFMLLSIYFLDRGKLEHSYISILVAVLIKFQSVVLLPVIVIQSIRTYRAKAIGKALLVACSVAFVLLVPFIFSGTMDDVVMDGYIDAARSYPYITLNAYNLWWLFNTKDGMVYYNETPEDDGPLIFFLSYREISLALLVSFTIFILYHQWKKKDLYLSSFMMAFAGFMISTRVHERYLFPAIALLAVLMFRNKGFRWIYGLLSFTFLVNLTITLTMVYNGSGMNQLLNKVFTFTPGITVYCALANLFVLSFLIYKMSGLSLGRWKLAFVSLVALFLFSRFYLLDIRPVHHDEGVFTHFIFNIMGGNPFDYWYDAHGPILFYLTALVFFIFGISSFTLRLIQASLGFAVVFLFIPLRRYLGDVGSITALAFLLVSPTMIYYSRFAFHESYFAFVSLASVIAIFRFMDTRRDIYLYLSAASLTLLFFIKETAYFFYFILATFFGVVYHREIIRFFIRKYHLFKREYPRHKREFDNLFLLLLVVIFLALRMLLYFLGAIDLTSALFIKVSNYIPVYVVLSIFFVLSVIFSYKFYSQVIGFFSGVIGFLWRLIPKREVNKKMVFYILLFVVILSASRLVLYLMKIPDFTKGLVPGLFDFIAYRTVTEFEVFILLSVFIIYSYFLFKRIGGFPNLRRNMIALLIVVGITIVLASSFFAFPTLTLDRLGDNLLHNLNKTTTTGHNKPWPYFLGLFWKVEPVVLLFGVLGILVPWLYLIIHMVLRIMGWPYRKFFLLPHDLFHGLVVYWAIFMVMVSAYIPYKTPWNIVYQTLPLILLGGIVTDRIYAVVKSKVVFIVVGILVLYTGYSGVMANYVNYDDEPNNPLVYVQTTPVVEELSDYIISVSQGKKVLVTAKEYWPLPFYIRDLEDYYLDVTMLDDNNIKEYDVFVSNSDQIPGYVNMTRKEFEMRPGVNIVVLSK